MLNIWKKKRSLKIKTSLKSYLYKACYHEFITQYNKKKRETTYIDTQKKIALEFFIEEDPEVIKGKIKKVYIEIEKLPPRCKEIFILSKIQGLRYREIAETLHISIKTVEKQISKALSKIKEALPSRTE